MDSNRFEVGTPMQIQVGQLTTRRESTLIGIRPDKYLILTMPGGPGQPAIRPDETGTPLIVRYIHQGNAYGFKSTVVDVITTSEKLLVISYPLQIEVHKLRNYPRASCLLPARLFVDKLAINGSLIDISRTGANFTCIKSEEGNHLAQYVTDPVNLHIKLPGMDGHLQIVGNLRKTQTSSRSIELGIRFDTFAPGELIKLLAFLLDANALPEHQSFTRIIQKHYQWRERVYQFIHADGEANHNFALSPDECELGKWLSSEGKRLYGASDEYLQLDKTHRELHQNIEAAVKIKEEGELDRSIEFFNQLDIQHISHRIAALLIAADEISSNTVETTVSENKPRD